MTVSSNRTWLSQVLVVAALAWGGWALAQDPAAEPAAEAEPAADAAADPAAEPAAEDAAQAEVAADAGDAAAEAPAVPVQPRPAEMAPLTPRRELLDVVQAGNQLVAVGDRGGIIVSADGASWAQVAVPVRAALTAVAFADAQNGWAVGHDAAIVSTKDGGRTWMLQNFQPELEKPFLDVLFLDAQRGYAVGAYGLFYQTVNGGGQWTEVDAPAIRADEVHFNGIARLNDGSLFIAGEQGMLGWSADGVTWEKITSPYDASLFGALPHGEKGAVIYGLRGNAYLTEDVKGGNWTKIDTQTVASLFGGALLADGRMVLVGLNGAVLAVAPGGEVRNLRVPVRETDKAGREKIKDLSSALSAAIPFGGGVLLVGEEGVQRLALQ